MMTPSNVLRNAFCAGALSCFISALPVLSQTHKSPPTDEAILARVQHVLHQESAFSGLSITPTVAHGVVRLEGTVDSQAAKKLASSEVGEVAGVRTVLNDLSVAETRRTAVPSTTPEMRTSQASPRAEQTAKLVNLPEGTVIPVRIADEITSKTAKPGDAWHGTTSANVTANGYILIPLGAPVTGRVAEAKAAGHFTGAADLTLELTSVRLTSQASSASTQEVAITSSPWSSKTAGRGVNTAEKTGGGAAVGAIIGSLAGGGRGAGIGAASGGALGAGTNGISRGAEVDLKPEQLLQFRTTAPLNVTVMVRGGIQVPAGAAAGPTLETRPVDPSQTPQ